MKKTTLLTLSVLTMLFVSYQELTNSSGEPSGRSGSPASNNQTCASIGCHSGSPATTQMVSITSDIPSSGFEENTDYTITVTADGNGVNHSRIGFEASVESTSGHEGNISTTGNNAIQKAGSYVTHTFNGISAMGSMRSWSFTWNSGTAPNNTTVYAAVNFANSNGTTSGDIIVTESLALTKASGVGLDENKVYNFSLFPNPASDALALANVDPQAERVDIYSLTGQKVASFDNAFKDNATDWKVNISALPEGNYLVTTDREGSPHKNLLIKR